MPIFGNFLTINYLNYFFIRIITTGFNGKVQKNKTKFQKTALIGQNKNYCFLIK